MLPLTYILRNLMRAPWRSLQLLFGCTLVIFLLLAADGFMRGMDKALRDSGDANNVLILGAGAEDSMQRSEIPLSSKNIAAAALAKRLDKTAGKMAISPEVVYMTEVMSLQAAEKTISAKAAKPSAFTLRGVTLSALNVHRKLRIVSGRFPRSGEFLAGSSSWRRLGLSSAEQLQPGLRIDVEGKTLTLAGVFSGDGSIFDSELWLPLNDLLSISQRDSLSALVIRLNSPKDMKYAQLFVQQRLDLELSAIREQAYYSRLSDFFRPLQTVAWLTVILVVIGALTAGINACYAAILRRRRELATLRALGYRSPALWVAVLGELFFLSTSALLLALLMAAGPLSFWQLEFSGSSFAFLIDARSLILGIITSLALALIGTLIPMFILLRQPLKDALHSD